MGYLRDDGSIQVCDGAEISCEGNRSTCGGYAYDQDECKSHIWCIKSRTKFCLSPLGRLITTSPIPSAGSVWPSASFMELDIGVKFLNFDL